MPKQVRCGTGYPGVFYIEGKEAGTGRTERIFYITYRKDGKLIEEKAGRQFKNRMTAAKANNKRSERVTGKELTNKEEREAKKKEKEEAGKERWTVGKLWETYKEDHPDLKGLVTDENRFENYVKPVFGDKEPCDIIALDIDRLRINLTKTKKRIHKKAKKPATILKPATVRNVLELLRRIINFGVKKNLCEKPSFKITLPVVDNLKTEDLTQEQLSALLKTIEASENIQAKNLMKVALFSGLRRGELFRLEWSDIDFQRGFIRLRSPKGGREQTVPLNDDVRKILESHPHSEKSQFVFQGLKGKMHDMKRAVNKIKADAGLPDSFRALHGLRHVYASTLASSGKVDLYTLQRLLTHKSPQMTQRYAHLSDEALRRASSVMGEIVASATMPKVAELKPME